MKNNEIKAFHLSNGHTARSKHITVHTTIEGFCGLAQEAGADWITATGWDNLPEYHFCFYTRILNRIEKLVNED